MLNVMQHKNAQLALTHHTFAASWRRRLDRAGFDDRETAGNGVSHVCGRGLLQALLARAGDPGAGNRLYASSSGRLMVAGNEWYVSVSHAAPFTAATVARVPVGVDIEMRRRRIDWPSVVGAMFSPEMAERIWSAPSHRRREVFLREWTRAEACAKINDGLVVPLIAEDISARHSFFATEDLIGCVAIGSR